MTEIEKMFENAFDEIKKNLYECGCAKLNDIMLIIDEVKE